MHFLNLPPPVQMCHIYCPHSTILKVKLDFFNATLDTRTRSWIYTYWSWVWNPTLCGSNNWPEGCFPGSSAFNIISPVGADQSSWQIFWFLTVLKKWPKHSVGCSHKVSKDLTYLLHQIIMHYCTIVRSCFWAQFWPLVVQITCSEHTWRCELCNASGDVLRPWASFQS